jgi:hypothetical protein
MRLKLAKSKREGWMFYPFEVERNLWQKFLSVCKLQGKNGAEVLRKLIEVFINENKKEV